MNKKLYIVMLLSVIVSLFCCSCGAENKPSEEQLSEAIGELEEIKGIRIEDQINEAIIQPDFMVEDIVITSSYKEKKTYEAECDVTLVGTEEAFQASAKVNLQFRKSDQNNWELYNYTVNDLSVELVDAPWDSEGLKKYFTDSLNEYARTFTITDTEVDDNNVEYTLEIDYEYPWGKAKEARMCRMKLENMSLKTCDNHVNTYNCEYDITGNYTWDENDCYPACGTTSAFDDCNMEITSFDIDNKTISGNLVLTTQDTSNIWYWGEESEDVVYDLSRAEIEMTEDNDLSIVYNDGDDDIKIVFDHKVAEVFVYYNYDNSQTMVQGWFRPLIKAE